MNDDQNFRQDLISSAQNNKFAFGLLAFIFATFSPFSVLGVVLMSYVPGLLYVEQLLLSLLLVDLIFPFLSIIFAILSFKKNERFWAKAFAVIAVISVGFSFLAILGAMTGPQWFH